MAFEVIRPMHPTVRAPAFFFGPYQLDSVIARSDTATVYRAHDRRHGNRMVALKLFAPDLSADPMFRSRFRHDVTRRGALVTGAADRG
jgi:hypothetical protein